MAESKSNANDKTKCRKQYLFIRGCNAVFPTHLNNRLVTLRAKYPQVIFEDPVAIRLGVPGPKKGLKRTKAESEVQEKGEDEGAAKKPKIEFE